MATFESLKKKVLEQAGVRSHFEFNNLSKAHRDFWEKLNRIEFDRGYIPGEYEKPETPALCEMDLLSDAELQTLLKEAKVLSPQK